MSNNSKIEKATKSGRIWGGNLLVLCLTIAFCLALAEIAVRVLRPNMVLIPRFHAEASYGDYKLRRLRPNSVFWHTTSQGSWKFVTNSQGFRDIEDFAYEKPCDVLRVLSLGDSHTQGFEIRQDHTFSKVMERALGARNITAQVFNTGISGFSTSEQLAFFENEGIRYAPDFVVVGFYSNDFDDNIKAGLFELREGELVSAKLSHTPGVGWLEWINDIALLRWLSQNSYLYSFALNKAWWWAKELLLTENELKMQTELVVGSHDLTDYKKDLMIHLLKRLKSFSERNEIPLIILDVPQSTEELGTFETSVPAELVPTFEANSDKFLASEEALGEFRQTGEFHVSGGHHHISEFTHLILGIEAARIIEEILKREGYMQNNENSCEQ
jgi:hypothetical protein